jgi:hypothetical protein
MQTADNDIIQMNRSPASVTLNNYGTLTSLDASGGGAQAVDLNAIASGTNIIQQLLHRPRARHRSRRGTPRSQRPGL